MTLPTVKLDRGIHVLHLFYSIHREALGGTRDRRIRASVAARGSVGREKQSAVASEAAQLRHRRREVRSRVHSLRRGPRHGRANASRSGKLFSAGTLMREYSYFSVTELVEDHVHRRRQSCRARRRKIGTGQRSLREALGGNGQTEGRIRTIPALSPSCPIGK